MPSGLAPQRDTGNGIKAYWPFEFNVKTCSLRNALVARIRQHVGTWFGDYTWTNESAENYRGRVARAQESLNGELVAHLIAGGIRPVLEQLLQSDEIMVQSNVYLRAARPQIGGQESVGWHRESFYGCPPQALNVWVPIANVTPDNAIRYIPGSTHIPEAEIETTTGDNDGVQRGSSGHKIGLLYAPKRIIGGVDLSSAQPLPFEDGQASVFSSMLVHGAAENRTDRVRFSIDFRVIAREHVGVQKQHFASGKEMFEELLL